MTEPGAEGFPASLVLAGAGKMGGALLKAWLGAGLEPGRIHVLDPRPPQEILNLAASAGFSLAAPDEPPEVLVLAIKPQVLEEAAALAPLAAAGTLVISILAGKTTGNIAARLPSARAIVRAMPNLPASIGRGATGAVASEAVTPGQRAMTEALLGAAGHFEWLEDERLIDAVTAISGSGPAYVFYLTECLSEAGATLGLPPGVAARLARATVEGAGELLFRSPQIVPAALRESVTSPGGTTAAALEVLMAQDGLAPIIERTVQAAKRRAEALSG
jgi:pyrroline-5-carboxylate reductase